MKKSNYRRLTCRLCGKKSLTLALPLAPSPLGDEYIPALGPKIRQPLYPLNLMLCKQCGNGQLSHVIYPETIYTEYLYKTVSSLGLVEHFKSYADTVIKTHHLPSRSMVIDIGSNDGTLLRSFKNAGMRVLGIDPASHIAKAATQSGVPTLPHYFTPSLSGQIVKKYGKADVITANNVYANIDDLDTFIKGIKFLLKPEGLFIFETFYLLDFVRHMVFDFMFHEHLTYFSVTPLQKYFEKNGMRLIDVVRVPTKGGSIRCIVQRKEGSRKVSSSVRKIVSLESKSHLHTLAFFKSYAKRISEEKKKLHMKLNQLKTQGKRIAGYGASATSTTLIYHFGLENSLHCIFDEYEMKHNTLSPGSHIPVLPSQSIRKIKPDVIIILAWRYYLPIIQKNREFLSKGGTFLVPLPKFKIISKKNIRL